MHAVFFGSKRVHLEVVWRLTRPLLDGCGCGLTPARFDLMRLVHLRRERGTVQASLKWMLGVSASTISRMVRALEKLGFVRRVTDAQDRRYLRVYITDAGEQAVERALAATVGQREDQRAVARCATGERDHQARWTEAETTAIIEGAREKTKELEGALARMRRALRDRAPSPHPWHLLDFAPYKFHTVVDGQVRYGDEWALDPDWNPEGFWRAPS